MDTLNMAPILWNTPAVVLAGADLSLHSLALVDICLKYLTFRLGA